MADSEKGAGFKTNPTNALVVVLYASAVAPLRVDDGFLRDANGSLVVRSV